MSKNVLYSNSYKETYPLFDIINQLIESQDWVVCDDDGLFGMAISRYNNNQEDYDDVFKSDIWWPRQGGNKYIYLMADVNATFRADITVLEEKEIVLDFINHPEKCKLIASNAIINRDLAKLD